MSIAGFFKDKHGKIAIIDWPNLLLWGWIVCTVILMFAKHGRPHAGFMFLSGGFLFAWAYLEIQSGLSPFRRVLGALVMLNIVISHFR